MIARLTMLGLALALTLLAAWLLPALDRPPDRFTHALALLDDGRPEEAAILFENRSWQGVAQFRAERFNSALAGFLVDQNFRGFYNAGTAYARLHDWSAAKSTLRKALALEPKNADAQHNLAVVLRAEAREQELLQQSRATRQLGQWRDTASKGGKERGGTDGDLIEQGGTGSQPKGAARSRSSLAAPANMAGTPGDRQMAEKAAAGRGGGRADTDAGQTLSGGGGRAEMLRESRQAAESLLRQIADNPARVLTARLRAIHRQRLEEAGQ